MSYAMGAGIHLAKLTSRRARTNAVRVAAWE